MQLTTEYFYDELNQLIRENDPVANKTTTYVYDNGGNILEKREYDYTTDETLGTPTKTTEFGYVSTQWKDLLTSYTGHEILYDAVGNPLTFGDITMTWERGRKLSTMTFADGSTTSYKYNADGIRTQKTVNGVTTDYFLEGSTIVAQKTGNDVIWYYFDGDGTRDAIEYKGNVYYYMYNPQGDVIGLFDDELNVVVEYTYDSWGKILSITGPLQYSLGRTNPFRYRGYYYDNESGMYYLNSRYYHPEIGRFINADGYVQTGQGILDKNMFAYCLNNPVCYSDPQGTSVIGAIIAVCAVTSLFLLSGCSRQPKDYRDNDTGSQNCYSYAFDLQGYVNPGDYSSNGSNSRFSCEETYTVDEVADWVMRDMNYLDKSVRVVSSPNDKKENEKIVALKVILTADPAKFDYHFAVQLSNGRWADKMGPFPSRYDKIDGVAISWEIDKYKTYNSQTVYFAVGG